MSDVSGQERVICPACVLCFALVLYSALCGMCGMYVFAVPVAVLVHVN